MAIIGENEMESGKVKLKDMSSGKEVLVPMAALADKLIKKNCPAYEDSKDVQFISGIH